MGLLEVAAADLPGRDMRGNRQHRRPAAVRIEQAVDEVEIARPARPGAYGESAGNLRLTRGGESSHLLMSNLYQSIASRRLGEAVQAVSHHAEDAFHPGLDQGLGDQVSDVVDLHSASPWVEALGLALSCGAIPINLHIRRLTGLWL